MASIAAGRFKGMPLIVPRGIRATEAKVRQAIFNILRPTIEGARVLDGFAGSGALGLEALSQGASFAAFVESADENVIAIRDNLARAGQDLPSSAWRVVHADLERGLRILAEARVCFDIVLFDPPYGGTEGKKALNTLVQYAILAPAGIVGIEHEQRTVLPSMIGSLRQRKQHRYGDTVLSFYQPV